MRITTDHEPILRLSDELSPELVAPPALTTGVCPRCRTWNDSSDSADCGNCRDIAARLGRPAVPLSVASLYCKPSPLRDWLTCYKGRIDDSEPLIEAYIPIVRALLGRFIIERGQAIAAISGGLDGLVVVPSTERRGPHPLEKVIGSLQLDIPVLPILRRGGGDLGFRKPSREGYEVTDTSHAALRVVVVDDVYTTGARINSATYALTRAGCTVGAALVIARRVNPGYSEVAQEFWNSQHTITFDWTISPVVGEGDQQ